MCPGYRVLDIPAPVPVGSAASPDPGAISEQIETSPAARYTAAAARVLDYRVRPTIRYTDRERKTRIVFDPGRLRDLRASSGVLLLRRGRVARDAWAHFRVPISGAAASDEESVKLRRWAGLFGSRRCGRRGNRLARAAARRRGANCGTSCQHTFEPPGSSAVTHSSRGMSRCSSARVPSGPSPSRRFPGCFETTGHSRALWYGDRSLDGRYNTALEPAAFSSRVLVGQRAAAAQRER